MHDCLVGLRKGDMSWWQMQHVLKCYLQNQPIIMEITMVWLNWDILHFMTNTIVAVDGSSQGDSEAFVTTGN